MPSAARRLLRNLRRRALGNGASTAFDTLGVPGRGGRSTSPFHFPQVMAAFELLNSVTDSPLTRRLDLAIAQDDAGPSITSLEVRAAGFVGTMWIPLKRPPDLRNDIDGFPIVGVSSEGDTLEGYCVGVGATDGGATIRFVLTPSLPSSATSMQIAFQPILNAAPITLRASLE
jgi:hypothetical protein